MSINKKATVLQQKISSVESMIDVADYHGAARKLSLLGSDESMSAENRKVLDFLQLKVFNRLHWLVEAAPVVRRFASRQNLGSEEYLEIALFYMLRARLGEAERFMKKAIALDKSSFLLVSELAILYEQQGRREKALALYNKILMNLLEHKKMDAVGARVLNRLAGLRVLESKEIKQVSALCSKYAGKALEIRLLFVLAKCYAKHGDIEKEIKFLGRANLLADRVNEAQHHAQTIEASRKRLKAIQLLFAKADPPWMPEYFISDRAPVFVLGMPRSGTTLLEQILGAHSHVGNSGESRAMGIAFQRQLRGKSLLPEDVGTTLPFFRYKSLSYEDSKAIIKYYDQYQSLLSEKPVITDKELSNIDRVGIILKLYPHAKFICIQRHPLDVCVSIMQHDFSHAYFSASSLKIVQEYEAYYDKAMHWQKLYPESVLQINYESLVDDFDENARMLMNYIDLPWEENIKQFYKRNNSVRTPSLSQVRSEINASSIDKWKHYAELIQPAQSYLASRGFLPQSRQKKG